MATALLDRVAGAPISWGVCEAPDWGYEIAADRVLTEMRGLGLRSTELGPAGYLGDAPADVVDTVTRHELGLVGGFVPVPMHLDREQDLGEADGAMTVLAAAGAQVAVLAARSADGGYDRRVRLTEDQWPVLLANLARLQRLAESHGLLPTLHPHVGTAIEDRDSVLRLVESSDVQLCLDTGHLLIGGMHPTELLAKHADRVAHVHLKDVDAAVAASVTSGERAYVDAVRAGLYAPLGRGDVDIAACVRALEDVGYRGWYVLEQDCALPGEPPPGEGPVDDVRASLDFLTSLGG